MLLLAILLIVIGLVLLAIPMPFPNAHAIGGVLILIGVILLVVALVGTSGLGLEGDADLIVGGPLLLAALHRVRRALR
jgi:hypothetical protein